MFGDKNKIFVSSPCFSIFLCLRPCRRLRYYVVHLSVRLSVRPLTVVNILRDTISLHIVVGFQQKLSEIFSM